MANEVNNSKHAVVGQAYLVTVATQFSNSCEKTLFLEGLLPFESSGLVIFEELIENIFFRWITVKYQKFSTLKIGFSGKAVGIKGGCVTDIGFRQVFCSVTHSIQSSQPEVVVVAPNISRISTGKYWRTQDELSQGQFIKLMYELITATYADRFVSYNEQVFKIDSVESKGKDRWVVKSQLTKSDGETVTLDYYLRAGVIFNVVANGVSDLSLKRADYASILAQSGLSGLTTHIDQNIVDYRQGEAD